MYSGRENQGYEHGQQQRYMMRPMRTELNGGYEHGRGNDRGGGGGGVSSNGGGGDRGYTRDPNRMQPRPNENRDPGRQNYHQSAPAPTPHPYPQPLPNQPQESRGSHYRHNDYAVPAERLDSQDYAREQARGNEDREAAYRNRDSRRRSEREHRPAGGQVNPYQSLQDGRERNVRNPYQNQRNGQQRSAVNHESGQFNPYQNLIEQKRSPVNPERDQINPYQNLQNRREGSPMNPERDQFNPYQRLQSGRERNSTNPERANPYQHLQYERKRAYVNQEEMALNPYQSQERMPQTGHGYPYKNQERRMEGSFNPYQQLQRGRVGWRPTNNPNDSQPNVSDNFDDFSNFRDEWTRGDMGPSGERGGSRWEDVMNMMPSQVDMTKGTLRWRGTIRLGYLDEDEISLRRPNLEEEPEDAVDVVDSLERVREQPWPLGTRRTTRAYLRARLANEEGGRWYYSARPVTSAVKKGGNSILSLLKGSYFWSKILKPLEGRHGSSVVAVFNFLRAMIQFNFMVSLLLLLGVVVPGAIKGTDEHQAFGWFSPGGSGHNKSKNLCGDLRLENSTETWECNKNYTDSLEDITELHMNDAAALIQDFLQGTGFLEWTVLFSGYFPASVDSDSYLISLAYSLCVLVVYLTSLMFIVYFIAKFLRQSPQMTHNTGLTYSRIVLTGWDFAISESSAAKIGRSMVVSEARTAFDDEEFINNRKSRTRNDWIKLYSIRILINLLVICLTGGGWTGIYFLVKESETRLGPSNEIFQKFLWEYLPTVAVSTINVIYPMIFSALVIYEQYRGRTELMITLFRCVVIRLTSLAILIGVKLDLISQQSRTCDGGNGYICWETHMGQQLYSVLILDLLIQLGLTLVVNVGRMFLGRLQNSFCQTVGRIEFYVPGHVLDIVYVQSILWLSLPYSPLMPFICWFYFLVLFILKFFTVSVTCVPASRVFRASSSSAMFMTVLCVAYVLCGAASAVGLYYLQPSKACSPFRGLKNTWEAVTYYICRMDGSAYWLRWVFFAVDDYLFLGVVLILTVIPLVYYTSRLKASSGLVEVMENRLKQTAKDKVFLLKQNQQVAK